MHYLVTGANRGLGLEFTKQLLKKGHKVTATCREPEQAQELKSLNGDYPDLKVLKFDVSSPQSNTELAAQLKEAKVDVLINNAGQYSRARVGFDELNLDDVLNDFSINAIGTLRATQSILPSLRNGEGKKIINISSKMGSIHDNTSGGSYAYRMSKAAVNMATRSLANDLRQDGFVVLTFHPGWVLTDMGGPNALIGPEESIAGMLKVIEDAGPEESGRFWDYRGQEISW